MMSFHHVLMCEVDFKNLTKLNVFISNIYIVALYALCYAFTCSHQPGRANS